ncbi:MAG: hypothetical protein IT372_16850, partial [Polyangiaceae bacterium]|nr:hypothetical protein [Polyangiaceae bacterium]
AHAERATRILHAEGRGAAPPGAPGVETGDPTISSSPDDEDTVLRLSSRQRSRERVLFGVLLGLAIATLVIGWSAFSAYQESSSGGPPQAAAKGVAAATAVRAAVVTAVARLAASAATAAPTSSASAEPADKPPSGRRGGRGGRPPTGDAPPRATAAQEDVDPLSTRR